MLNNKVFVNNIYGTDEIKDDKFFERKIIKKINELYSKGIRRIAVYPMDDMGIKTCSIIFGLGLNIELLRIDDDLCKSFDSIISFIEFVKEKKRFGFHLLIASNNVQHYDLIRDKVKKKCECKEYTDMFPIKPLFINDSRIISLELASREIYYYGIEGAVAEVGVYRGYFAEYINYFFSDKPFYMFDTFCGFDERDIIIERKNNYSAFETGSYFLDTSEAVVMDKMTTPENCRCIKGYFPDSAKDVCEKKYCFVHLDTDLYLPTLNGLEYFYPKLAHGGYIFVHDFNGSAKGVRTAVKTYCDKHNIGYVCLPDSIIKGTIVITK